MKCRMPFSKEIGWVGREVSRAVIRMTSRDRRQPRRNIVQAHRLEVVPRLVRMPLYNQLGLSHDGDGDKETPVITLRKQVMINGVPLTANGMLEKPLSVGKDGNGGHLWKPPFCTLLVASVVRTFEIGPNVPRCF